MAFPECDNKIPGTMTGSWVEETLNASIWMWFRSFLYYNSDVRHIQHHHKNESFVSIKGKNINKFKNDEEIIETRVHTCSTSLNKHPLQLFINTLLFWFELQREQIYESECPVPSLPMYRNELLLARLKLEFFLILFKQIKYSKQALIYNNLIFLLHLSLWSHANQEP